MNVHFFARHKNDSPVLAPLYSATTTADSGASKLHCVWFFRELRPFSSVGHFNWLLQHFLCIDNKLYYSFFLCTWVFLGYRWVHTFTLHIKMNRLLNPSLISAFSNIFCKKTQAKSRSKKLICIAFIEHKGERRMQMCCSTQKTETRSTGVYCWPFDVNSVLCLESISFACFLILAWSLKAGINQTTFFMSRIYFFLRDLMILKREVAMSIFWEAIHNVLLIFRNTQLFIKTRKPD